MLQWSSTCSLKPRGRPSDPPMLGPYTQTGSVNFNPTHHCKVLLKWKAIQTFQSLLFSCSETSELKALRDLLTLIINKPPRPRYISPDCQGSFSQICCFFTYHGIWGFVIYLFLTLNYSLRQLVNKILYAMHSSR